jgi:hypothetical protein
MLLMITVQEAYSCHQYYTVKADGNPAPHEEMPLYLASALKMGHNQYNSLKQYWCRTPICQTPFCSRVMRRIRFLHILPFLHFENEMLPTGTENVMTGLGN